MLNHLKIILLILILGMGLTSFGQYPSDLHNEDLREWLISNTYNGEFTDLGYSPARQQMYSYTDEVGGKIYCIYTDFQMDAEFTTFPDPINAEHIIPQSFYGGVSPMRSDIHNLRPSHQNANSERGSLDFGEVTDNQAIWYGITSGGNYFSTNNQPSVSDNFSEGTEVLWEPQEDRKGDVARQIFYFYTMYPTQAGSIADLTDLNLVYQWHLDDPVDDLEAQRNDRIEEVQGNRNPYIDHEGLVYDAWLWEEILGCIDPPASNYDPNANTDDGSCIYESMGCTDPDYLEFSSEAVIDDGSCATPIVYGCRYPNALNYNPNANRDDNGSCLFDAACIGDLDSDNAVTVGDLTLFLALYNSVCE